MLRDVLAITVTIVILAVGTAVAFRNVVLFGQTITAPQSVAPKPAAKERPAARVSGGVKAIDKEERTVTLVDRLRGTLTLPVQDPQKLADVKIGDPVVAATSKPEDIASSPVESQVTLTVAIVAVDGTNGMLTIKDPEGDAETVKVQDKPAGM